MNTLSSKSRPRLSKLITVVALSGAALQALASVQPAFAGATLASDSFNRTVTTGWGAADTGGAWTIIDRPANWSVIPGAGAIKVGAGTDERAYLGAVVAQDVELLQKVVLPRSTQNNNCLAYVIGRYAGGSNPTYYRVGVGQGTHPSTVSLRAQRSDGTFVSGDVNTGIPAADGVVIWLRAQFQGVNPTVLRARAWVDGNAEPTSWQLTGKDSNAAEQIVGSVGIRAKNEDTSMLHSFIYRSFQASSLTPSPTVTGISPASGPAAGGTAVTITGTGFSGATSVKFGASAAATFTVISATQVTATSPAGSGTVDVTVSTANGTSATGSADQFAYLPRPAVTGLSPGSGPAAGGTTVAINGSGFSGATGVKFGPASVASFTVTSSTQITTTSPAGSGTVDVIVTTPGGTSPIASADQFTYIPAPVVTGLSPGSGPAAGGTTVTISGSGFIGATSVTFGTSAASFTVINPTQISAIDGAGSGTVHVTVTTAGGTSATGSADQFTYAPPPPPAPAVTGLSPSSGPVAGGTTVTINGTRFTGATAVTFGSAAATSFTVISDSQITATNPSGSGMVDVTVTTAGGTSATGSADQFTYIPLPVVTGISLSSGPAAGGTTVTISGNGFSGATSATFGASAATSFTVTGATQVTATSPAGSGTVDVTVTTAGGTSAIGSADQFTYIPLPVVTGISPSIGPTAGGTVVTIAGTGFSGATVVTFGATAATSFSVSSPTQVSATSPAGSGTADVTVSTAGGTSATSGADQFTYIAPPIVTGLSPSSGPEAGGTSIILSGSGFSSATSVTFGATGAGFTANGDAQITAISPPGTGTAYITVTTPGGTSAIGSADQFTFVPAPPGSPAVTGLSPTSGPAAGDTTVMIAGTNFTGTTAVTFGTAAAASFTITSDTQITATDPAGSGIVDVTVTTAAGTSALGAADHFTYLPQPVITGLSPTSGPSIGGTQFTISGSGFTGATAVTVGGTAAGSFTVNGDAQIVAVTPAGSGTVDVIVTTPGGTSAIASAEQFTYIPAPVVSGLSPGSGPAAGGTTVTISGSGFNGATNVTFGASAASFTVINPTQVTATSPSGSGTVDVTVSTGGGTSAIGSADQFTYIPLPVVTGLSPSSGSTAGSTVITISGTGFSGATVVTFGASAATSFSVSSPTQVTATNPAGSGMVDVTVTTAGGTSATGSVDQFTYIPLPVVTGISPSSGPAAGGTTVTISGNGFSGATSVTFGASAATSLSVTSATQLTAASPAGSGTADVTVTTGGGTSAIGSADQFTYIPLPVVTGISPSIGPTAGGTVITIAGTGFSGATVVTFGASVATSFSVSGPTQLTATSPAGSGTLDVTVTTAGGTSGTGSADQFTYIAPPIVTGLSPSSGPTAGGTVVTISGTGFSGATAVKFGATAATSFSVTGATQVTATSPAGSGTVHVMVTTAGGTSATRSADQFTYIAPPLVSSVSPSSGPTGGGTVVTISGTGFAGATAVKFGASAATSFSVTSASQVTATSPAGSGTVDVTVSTAGGTSATSSADQFTYMFALSTVASDSFNRTASNGWGTADVGGPWSIVDTPTSWSVSPGAGSINVAAGAQERAYLSATSVQDVEVRAKVVLPKSTQGDNCLAYILGRYVAGSSPTYYRIGVGQGAGDNFVIIRAQTDTGAFIAPDVNTTTPASDGAVVWLHVQFQGANPTAIRARAWADGTAEPALWALDTTDSTATQQVSAAVGLRMRNEDTAAAHTFKLNSITATSMTPRTLPTGFATDGFDRTVAGGWGTADLGGAWSGTGSPFSITPGRATIVADSTTPTTFLTANSVRDVDLLAWISPPTRFSGAPTADCGIGVRYMQATGAFYQVSVFYPSAINGTNYAVQLKRKPDNVEINPDFMTSIPGGTAIWLRLEAQGVGPTTLRWKIWQDGTTEPTAWTATGTDSTAALQGAGGVGVEAFSSSGTMTVAFNALTATGL